MNSPEGAAAARVRTARQTRAQVAKSLRRRYRAERRFRACGIGAVLLGVLFVLFLIGTIVTQGYGAFRQTWVSLDVHYDPALIDPAGTRNPGQLRAANYQAVVRAALGRHFPEVEGRAARRELAALVSGDAAFELQRRVLHEPGLIGTRERLWVLGSDELDAFVKGHGAGMGSGSGFLSDRQIAWAESLRARGLVQLRFNRTFFTRGDSREPEQAGVWGAVVGSALTLVLTLALSFPVGVATAVYLEELAPRNRWTDLIEVNLNNLAAVPSIIFGLLGLAVFIGFFGMPRSAPLAGAVVLTLLTLPTIIIAGRAALQAVPPSIREAALGMGASRLQVVVHHVLPLAVPGMLTGTVIGMARALGETAPLLMIGMVAFIVEVPAGFTDPATVLPVQIFLWADSPERAFVERTWGAIIVLLAFLLVMNAAAVVLRSRFEKRFR